MAIGPDLAWHRNNPSLTLALEAGDVFEVPAPHRTCGKSRCSKCGTGTDPMDLCLRCAVAGHVDARTIHLQAEVQRLHEQSGKYLGEVNRLRSEVQTLDATCAAMRSALEEWRDSLEPVNADGCPLCGVGPQEPHDENCPWTVLEYSLRDDAGRVLLESMRRYVSDNVHLRSERDRLRARLDLHIAANLEPHEEDEDGEGEQEDLPLFGVPPHDPETGEVDPLMDMLFAINNADAASLPKLGVEMSAANKSGKYSREQWLRVKGAYVARGQALGIGGAR